MLGLRQLLQFLQRMEPLGLRLLGQRLWAGHERFWLVQFLYACSDAYYARQYALTYCCTCCN